ncbi:uncharacterized protein LOC122094738 [Macadamia integrifolia]|uniref:uncharacterized protein LOC122094738 n=1 Tax=Macadamia integrifolia TaxID=60698 RepID=UPI001C52C6A3|nr:uncharacterized protein LOC122094738 [Macadamia integrifolia]
MSNIVRKLFTMILVSCEPGDVRKLWNNNFKAMFEDIKRTSGTVEYHTLQTLRGVNSFLQSMGRSIQEYELPQIDSHLDISNGNQPREIEDEYSINMTLEEYEAANKLNVDKKCTYDIILQHVESKNSGIFFIDDPGGIGKTFLYRAILAIVRSKSEIALAIATSRVAVAIIPGGRTTYSRFEIPINIDNSTVCGFSKQSATAELIHRAKVIIWDEAPMAKIQAIEVVVGHYKILQKQ